jgi:RNAse (barnase) inhibitor barstar
MQDIQDIAELADHHQSANFNVLLITHRNLNQYFLSYGEELQNEFKRIQGRFKLYHTQSDPATFIRLSSQVTSGYRINWDQKYNFENEVVKYDLFPELNGREKKTIVVENSYPLHPVTLYTLPRLANAVAQNERTLFTFLESNENGGLANYYNAEKTWYYASNLFDYFEPAFQEFTSDSLIGKSYLKYLRVQKRVGNSASSFSELQVLKLLTLWDIASLNSKRRLTLEFISFVLNWDQNKVNEVINLLESKKLIRYRLFDENWEVFEGSAIDLN